METGTKQKQSDRSNYVKCSTYLPNITNSAKAALRR